MSETLAKPVPALAEIEAAAAAQESRSRAIDMAIRALGAGNDAPLVLQLVAEGLEEDGRAWDAAGLAQKAARLAPDDFSAWLRLGRLQRKIRQWRDARESAERAVAIDPSSVDARMLYAAALFDLSDFDEAKREAEEAARLRPEAAEPLATLARVNVRLSKFEEARDFAQRALALEPHHAGAGIALASADFAQGHPGRAAERCRTLLQRLEIPDQARAEILSVLGDSMDALLRHQDAFAFYQASNHLMEKAAGQSGSENSRRAVDHAGMIENYFRGASLAQWRERPGGDRANFGVAGHAFLVGFPRSGTTLLESALDRHPSIVALAETDALRMCAGDLMADEDALGRLVRLDEKAIRECRSIYWNRAAALLDEPIHGKTIVDKLPIGTVALPVISKLFPEARIIFALRDPRDVVFSCFRRLFGANEVMYELLTLERAANYYDQVMRLADLCGRRLPLEVLTVRNEDVVSDFDGELGRTLNFLELEFDPVVRDFAARGSLARTPSAAQLAQGLNDRGIGAWKRYARWMRPILPILEPWVRRYGYAPTDPALLPAAASPELISIRAAVGGSIGAGRWREAFSAVDDA
ncbi:MAG: sulfotransferase, partial [Caulobacteraceae bacterium]